MSTQENSFMFRPPWRGWIGLGIWVLVMNADMVAWHALALDRHFQEQVIGWTSLGGRTQQLCISASTLVGQGLAFTPRTAVLSL